MCLIILKPPRSLNRKVLSAGNGMAGSEHGKGSGVGVWGGEWPSHPGPVLTTAADSSPATGGPAHKIL